MVDRLNGLRHYTIISGYYENSNIRGICTTHTHCRKCLMTRCIKESDLLAVNGNNVCTDVLCNTACFLIDHMGIPDGIQKRCLTMVNMAHDTDNRRTWNKCLFRILLLFQ